MAKTTAGGKSHGMRTFRKGKIWRRRTRVWWTKITVIYKDRLPNKGSSTLSESFKSVKAWVIETSYNCALAHYSCKHTAENFDRHVTNVVTIKIIFDKNSTSIPLSLLLLPWHQFELDMWSWLVASFRVRDREYISIGFIFRISETQMVFRCW